MNTMYEPQSSSALNHATQLWIDELSKSADDLGIVEVKLQNDFGHLVSNDIHADGQHRNDDVPNLVQIIRRIKLLSISMNNIRQTCIDLEKRKAMIMPSMIQSLFRNQTLLDELMESSGLQAITEDDSNGQEQKSILQLLNNI